MLELPYDKAIELAYCDNLSHSTVLKDQTLKGNATVSLSPPKEGKDWGLVIDDAVKKFAPPGKL
jgi:hypothetical protein